MNRIAWLDGIRGLAISLVLLYHLFGYSGWFSFAWSGVDLFFVLSGFLITSSLYRNDNAMEFLKRRALRILPAYLLVLLVLAGLNLYFDKSLYEIFKKSFLHGFFLQNFYLLIKGKYIYQFDYSHLWSVIVEVHFYILWLFLFIRYRFSIKNLAISLFVLTVVIRLLFYWFDIVYLNYLFSFTRLDAFMIGVIIFLLVNSNQKSKAIEYGFFISVMLITVFAIFSSLSNGNEVMLTFGFAVVAFMYGGLIYFANQYLWLQKIFESKLLRILGKYSYGIYLYHYVIYFYFRKFTSANDLPLEKQLLISLLTLIITFIFSYISYHYFEVYFLRYKKPSLKLVIR